VVAVAAIALHGRSEVHTIRPAQIPPTSSTTTTEAPRPTTVAKGENVVVGGFGGLRGQRLNIDAGQQDGEVNGEFRVNNVVVTIQCADISSDTRDLILGGEVTHNPDGQGVAHRLDNVNVAVGNRIALIIRETDPNLQRVTLYDPTLLPPPGNEPA